MGAILAAAGLVSVGGFVWTWMKVRRSHPGEERDALVNSFWFLAGGAVLLLFMAMGLAEIGISSSAKWFALSVSVVLTAIGGVKARRLNAARRDHLLADREHADTVADRIEGLEALGTLDLGPPIRWRVVLLGGKLLGAAMLAWAAYTLRHPTFETLTGLMAALHLIWAGTDVYGIAQARSRRQELDEEVDLLLAAPEDGGLGDVGRPTSAPSP